MTDILRFLQNRNSAPKLIEPAPSAAQMQEVVGFLYIGTREGTAKSIPQLDAADFVSNW